MKTICFSYAPKTTAFMGSKKCDKKFIAPCEKQGERVKKLLKEAHEDLKNTLKTDLTPFHEFAKEDVNRLKNCAEMLWNGNMTDSFDDERSVVIPLKLDENGDIIED